MNKPYSFTVDEEKDPDIVAWLDNIPKGQLSAVVRDAIRCQMGQERDLSNRELRDLLLAAISEIKITAAPAVIDQDGHSGESHDIIEALTGLGEW